MKKTLLLLAALCCAAMSMLATNYEVWITSYANAEIQVTSDNKDDILGHGNQQLSFNPETNTLTFRQTKVQSNVYGIRTTIDDFTIKTQLAEDPSEAGPLPGIQTGDNDYAITFPDKLTITGNATFFLSAKTSVFSKTTNIHLDNMEERDNNPLSGNFLVFQVMPTYYYVWINDIPLSDLQPAVLGASYDDSKKELTLTSANLNSIRTTNSVLNIVSKKADYEGAPSASYIINSGAYGIEISAGTTLNISGDCALYIYANVAAINNITSVTLDGLKEKDNKALNSKEIGLEPYYNISINGQQLTATSEYVNHGGAPINYVPEEKVLYLSNNNTNDGLYSLSIDDPEISVVIAGDNRICSNTDYAVEISSPLSISGSGTLFVEAKKRAITADVVLSDGLEKIVDTPNKVFISLPVEKKPTLGNGEFSIDADTKVKFYEQSLWYASLIDTYAFETEELQQPVWSPYLPWNEDYQQVNVLNAPDDYTLLSQAHWGYIFRLRPNALYLWASATVDDVHGYVILPDDWELPKGLNFTPTMMQTKPDFSVNTYSQTDWQTMADAGAVFLPALGYRNATTPLFPGSAIAYWTSTVDGAKYVALTGSTDKVEYQSNPVEYACPVRLVHIVDPNETGIIGIQKNTAATKLLFDGQLLILRDGKTYNAQGVEL